MCLLTKTVQEKIRTSTTEKPKEFNSLLTTNLTFTAVQVASSAHTAEMLFSGRCLRTHNSLRPGLMSELFDKNESWGVRNWSKLPLIPQGRNSLLSSTALAKKEGCMMGSVWRSLVTIWSTGHHYYYWHSARSRPWLQLGKNKRFHCLVMWMAAILDACSDSTVKMYDSLVFL